MKEIGRIEVSSARLNSLTLLKRGFNFIDYVQSIVRVSNYNTDEGTQYRSSF